MYTHFSAEQKRRIQDQIYRENYTSPPFCSMTAFELGGKPLEIIFKRFSDHVKGLLLPEKRGAEGYNRKVAKIETRPLTQI